MPLDGLTLKPLVGELNALLQNGRLMRIFQPQKYTLTLHFRLPGKTEVLLLSADPARPRLHTLAEQLVNPPAPPPFCMLLRKYLEPSRLVAIQQQGWDRIVHFYLEAPGEKGQLTKRTLIFELMGRHSNIFLVDDRFLLLDALKRYPQKNIVPGASYNPPWDQGKRDPKGVSKTEFINEIRLMTPDTLLWKWLQNTLQGFSPLAAREVVNRAGFTGQTRRAQTGPADWGRLFQALQMLLQEVSSKPVPSHHESNFSAYRLVEKPDSPVFASVNSLIAEFMESKAREAARERLRGSLRQELTKHDHRLQKTEALQKQSLKEAEQARQFRRLGELLTANFHLLQEGLSSVEVMDYWQDTQPMVRIELDAQLSPSANIQRLFKRYNKAKTSQKITKRRLTKTQRERRYLEQVLLQVEEADCLDVLQEIEEELKTQGYRAFSQKEKVKKSKVKSEPARFLASDGSIILVGRNNRQNDEVTFRLGRPQHVWFHAQKIAGSHVLVLTEQDISESTILEAAFLAARFSQAKGSPKVPVDYTLRKFVRKPKGAKPGFVVYENFQTIVVDPTSQAFSLKKLG